MLLSSIYSYRKNAQIILLQLYHRRMIPPKKKWKHSSVQLALGCFGIGHNLGVIYDMHCRENTRATAKPLLLLCKRSNLLPGGMTTLLGSTRLRPLFLAM